jgi:hypothetical protein
MKKFLSFILLAILVSNCKEDTANPPAESKIYFKGLTQTDVNGWPITIDTTDWMTNDTWVKQESDLFAAFYNSGCLQNYKNEIAAYPNPAVGIFNLHINKLESTRLELRLVDKNFNPLFSNDSVLGNAVQFDARVYGIKDTLRLYYKFIENNCEFRGHGDILIK